MVAGVRVESNGIGDGESGWGFMPSSQVFTPMSGFAANRYDDEGLQHPSAAEFECHLRVEGLRRLENPSVVELEYFLLRVPHERCLSNSHSKTPVSFYPGNLVLYSGPR